jgi:chromosome segregation ATPase
MASRALAVSSRSAAAAGAAESSVSSKKTTKTYKYSSDGSGNVSTEVHTHVDSSSDVSQHAIRRLEEQLRVINSDLDSEQQLRRRIEREKHELQMQIISLSERLTEAEGGAESQLDINRKREAEMAKLRKLLEDVHMEAEQSIHLLKKKHQEAMMELQEQIEMITRSKEKVSKEKSKLSVDIQELIAQIEVLSQEKVSIRKVCEKLEVQVHEYNVKIEDMNRAVIDMTTQKARLQQENADTFKKMNDMKMAIEGAGLDKNRVASQLKDLQTNLDNISRMKQTAEQRVQSMEQVMKTITIELEENRDMRLELERQIGKWREEGADWKKRYENEARLRIEDVDMLKKKFGAQLADLQDQLDAALRKLREVEQQKGRLQQEVQVLIKDLEISQVQFHD